MKYWPEESDAAKRREALRAERILLMCPNSVWTQDTIHEVLAGRIRRR